MPLPPPPPVCIVIGDSIAVGTAGALASEGLRCEVHARVGASSAEMLRTFTDGGHRARAVIALGSNDAGNPNLLRNLVALRQRVRATRVAWVTPYAPAAARISAAIARSFGDEIDHLAAIDTRDGIHPASYRSVALSLSPSPRYGGVVVARQPRAVAPAPAARPVRQAVVMTF